MAGLVVNFEVEEGLDRKKLYLYETTGAYQPVINLGGYGGYVGATQPNPFLTDVTAVSVQIAGPNGISVTLTPSLTDLPSLDPESGYEITNVMLGLPVNALLPDGIYTIKYIVSGSFNGAFESSAGYDILIKGQAQDCVDKAFSDETSEVGDCDCEDSDKLFKKLKNKYLLKAAENAADCSKPKRAKLFLDYVVASCNDDCNKC